MDNETRASVGRRLAGVIPELEFVFQHHEKTLRTRATAAMRGGELTPERATLLWAQITVLDDLMRGIKDYVRTAAEHHPAAQE